MNTKTFQVLFESKLKDMEVDFIKQKLYEKEILYQTWEYLDYINRNIKLEIFVKHQIIQVQFSDIIPYTPRVISNEMSQIIRGINEQESQLTFDKENGRYILETTISVSNNTNWVVQELLDTILSGFLWIQKYIQLLISLNIQNSGSGSSIHAKIELLNKIYSGSPSYQLYIAKVLSGVEDLEVRTDNTIGLILTIEEEAKFVIGKEYSVVLHVIVSKYAGTYSISLIDSYLYPTTLAKSTQNNKFDLDFEDDGYTELMIETDIFLENMGFESMEEYDNYLNRSCEDY